jgi:DNA-binding CsgD family transcriptional regulator
MTGAAVTVPLLERSDELARIESALGEARSGTGTFLVVEGPAGIGKTSLLAAARTAAAENGMRVLRSRATELERDFPFGIVRQLFEPALVEASGSERAELLEGAAGIGAGLLGLAGTPAPARVAGSDFDPSFAILHGLYWLCANLAVAGPLCVVVDDAHWADAPSLRFLAFLVTRLEELNVTLVVATRPSEARTDPEVLARLAESPAADVIRLAPLTHSGVAEVVSSRLQGPADRLFVDACGRATGGTPFLLHELVTALREEGIAPTADSARDVERIGARSIGRTLQLRLRRLPDNAGRLAEALAVLEQSDLLHAARLADLDEAEAAEAAELLASAGILDTDLPLKFVHPIVRSGIYSELSDTERAQAHRRAAHALADLPDTRERVGQHLLASESTADPWAVERLVEAARAAQRHGARELEAVYLRRALAEPAPAEGQGELLLELGVAEASAGIDGWHEHLQEAVAAAPDVRAGARAARALARAANRAQRFGEAVEVLDRAASALGPQDTDLALRLEAAAVIVGLNEFDVSPSSAARRQALQDRALADETAPPDVLAAAAFVSVLANLPAGRSAELALRAEERLSAGADGERLTSADLFARTTLTLLWAERYGELMPLLDASITRARAAGDSGLLALGLANRAWLELRRGDLRAAEADTRTALAATELPAPPMYRVLNLALLVETLVQRGELDRAEEELAPFDPEAERRSLIAAVVRFARGRLRAEQGRLAEALEDFLAVGDDLQRVQVSSPSYLPWRSEAALVQLALGDPVHAQALAHEELELARAFGSPRALGVAKHAAGVVDGGAEGERLLRDAVAALVDGEARLERARALTDLGAMLRRGNRRSEARELLREALDVAHRAGAERLAERAETELRATGARPRRVVLTGLDSLTASERRIAELASQDLTNREIAQLLFVTDRTVEGHLTSVFRKLRLDSRTELAGALAEEIPISA